VGNGGDRWVSKKNLKEKWGVVYTRKEGRRPRAGKCNNGGRGGIRDRGRKNETLPKSQSWRGVGGGGTVGGPRKYGKEATEGSGRTSVFVVGMRDLKHKEPL